jgi:hypothetical protein
MIGVNGPEFFAPEKDGQVIPNDKLNFAGFMHAGGNVTTKAVGEGHMHPEWDKGTPHKHGTRMYDKSKSLLNGTAAQKAQLRTALIKGGWKSEEDIENALSIIKYESGGIPDRENFEDKDVSYGLFQINMKNDWGGGANEDMGKKRLKDYARYGIHNYWDLYDPVKNARAAWAISSEGRQFKSWSTKTKAGLDGPIFGHPRRDDPFYDTVKGKLRVAAQGVTDFAGGVVDKASGVASDVFNFAKDGVTGSLGGIKGIINSLKGALGKTEYAKLIAELGKGLSDVVGARAEGGPVSASGASGNGGYNVNYGGITIKVEGSANWDENKLASEIKKALDYDNLIRKAVSH